MEATKTSGRKSPSQDLVRQMRAEGQSDQQVRANLEAKGFSKSRISQLIHAVPLQPRAAKRGPEEGAPGAEKTPAKASKARRHTRHG